MIGTVRNGVPKAWRGSRFRYTGQIAPPEVALYYYEARVYDPKGLRFLQTDPVGYKSDIDLYAYAGEDAVNRSDPTGPDTVVQLRGYTLGHYPWGGTFGHSYAVVTDTKTGESYVLRGGPVGGAPSTAAVVLDSPSARTDGGRGPITLGAEVDPTSRGPDTKPGGYSDQHGGSKVIQSANLGYKPISTVVKAFEDVSNKTNVQDGPYLSQNISSNKVEGAGFTDATGQVVSQTPKYPGLGLPVNAPPPPPPPPKYDLCQAHPGAC